MRGAMSYTNGLYGCKDKATRVIDNENSSRQFLSINLGRVERIVIFLAALGLAFAASLKLFGVSRDYLIYKTYFDWVAQEDSVATKHLEPMFLWSCRALAYFGFSVDVLYFTYVLLSILIKFCVLRLIAKNNVPIIVYTLMFYSLHEYTQIRVSIAIAFVYLAIVLYRNVWLLSIGSMFFAGALHYSSVVLGAFFAVALAVPRGIRSVVFVVLLFCLLFLPVSLDSVYIAFPGTNIENYLGKDVFARTSIFDLQNLSFIGISCSILFVALRSHSRVSPETWVCLAGCLVAVPIAYFFRDMPIFAYRFKELFMSLMPISLAFINQDKKIGVQVYTINVLSLVVGSIFLVTYLRNGIVGDY